MAAAPHAVPSTSPPHSPSQALNVVPAARGTCGAESARCCCGEGRAVSSRAGACATWWELDRRVVPPASSTRHPGLLWFLAAATDCSSYFKLGVKGTTFQKCEHTSLCYAPSWVCDGANDCGDYSDERNCPGESGERKGGAGRGEQGCHASPLAGCSSLGSAWAVDALFAHQDRHPLPAQLLRGGCCRALIDAGSQRAFGEEFFRVWQFQVGRRQDTSAPPPLPDVSFSNQAGGNPSVRPTTSPAQAGGASP